MDPDRYQQVKTLFADALETPPDRRDALLAEAPPDLRDEVEALLDAEARIGDGFLDRGALISDRPDFRDGARVGPFRLAGLLGEGGMGRVYAAHRDDGVYEQEVALKVVKRGMDSDAVLRRFHSERQILARLQHPGIARLLDGGQTLDGRPYLVMERVSGEPITTFAERAGLDVEGRVRLLLQVCDAVAFAHVRLVVHRDLKPSNVLVDEDADGRPRATLLDFGIARVLKGDPDEALTETGLRPMTRPYAAPEQVAGDAVTTATDVWALGVLLYELLTGRRPFQADSRAALESAILQSDPARPSTAADATETAPARPTAAASGAGPLLARRLRGDLDAIVLTCLAKEPARRYPTAAALADDLRRHLDGRPIAARTPTLAYRARKFAGRHRAVLAVVAVAVLLAATFGTAAAVRITHERDRARLAADEAEAVAETQGQLLRVLEPTFRASTDSSGGEVGLREALEQARSAIEESLTENPAALARSLASLGTAYFERGDHVTADSLFTRALTLRRQSGHDNDHVIHEALLGRGLVARSRGDMEAARTFFREAVAIQREHPDAVRATPGEANDSALLFLLGSLDDSDATERGLLRMLTLRRSLFSDTSISVAQVHNDLGAFYFNQSDFRQAYAEYTAAERIVRLHWGEVHPNANTLRGNLAYTASAMGQPGEAERHARIALAAARRAGLGAQKEALHQHSLGHALYYQGEHDEAEALIRSAQALYAAETGPASEMTMMAMKSLVVVLGARGKMGEALALAQEIEALDRRAGTAATPDGLYDRSIVAGLLYATGQTGEAAERLTAIQRALRTSDIDGPDRAWVLLTVGTVMAEEGGAEEAEPLLREAVALQQASRPDIHPDVAAARYLYGRVLVAFGRPAEARPHLLAARGRVLPVWTPITIRDPDVDIARLLRRR